MKAPIPLDEPQRLETLRQYGVLDTPPEQSFDDLVSLAAYICQTPIALVSLVDESRQWFKSKYGLDASETARDIAFCAHTIMQNEVLEVRDAENDPRFKHSPLVTTDPHVRFYAGAPLVAPDGRALGALCVMDRVPRVLGAEQLTALRALSRNVVAQLELQRQARALASEGVERKRVEAQLQLQVGQLSASKAEADRLLALAQKSRRALLSVLEDEKRAGQNLRESEEKFRQLADNITDVFWITSPDLGKIHYISAGYKLIWGRSPESLYANPHEWVEAIVPEERERVFAIFGALIGNTPEVSVEYRIARPDGTVRWIHDRGFQVRDATGNLVRLAGVATDITERKTAEEALHRSENRLRIVTENARVGLVMINRERRYVFANGAYAKVLDLPSANIIGQRVADVLASVYEEQIRPRLDRAFDGESISYELRKAASGQDRHYAVKYEPTKIDGLVSLVIVVITDISDQRRAQEELLWKTAFLEAQVNSALDAILVVDSQGKKILQNQRLIELFQVPEQIAQAHDDTALLEHVTSQMKNPKEFLERVKQLYEHPDEIGRDEIEAAHGKILDRYSSPVQDKAGKYYGRIWSFRDITERRKLEAQFFQAQKMEGIGQLAGGVAHDFNNMLAVIQMHSDLLMSGGGLSAAQSDYAGEIRATVQRAAALTRQLLLFSRREVFQPRDLDLSESITNMAKMLRRTLGENVQMQLKLASQPMSIHADAGMMDQVLLNLAVNARDAMPNGGQLVVETSGAEFDEFAASHAAAARAGSFVCLSVSDSGCGIPPEVLPKIFEPFFTTKGAGKGTGLGLATVFGIVQQHQGWVNVYSEIDHGTTFRIYLPRLAKHVGPASAQPALAPLSGGDETILLVEDDPALRLAVRRSLGELGYRILEAPTGTKAIEVWKENRDEIQLLLTDLVMPDGMTGKDLAQRILQETPKLKVIYMSGYSAEVVGKDFPLKEGDNFLAKPFRASKLAKIVREKLDAKT